MRFAWILIGLGACVACGGVATDPAKTPDDIVAEEERAAADDQKEREVADTGGGGDDEELDADKKKKFDVRQSQIELKRAARSAITCPGSIGAAEKLPRNTAMVTLTFSNDGHVKEGTIDEAFAKTKIGACVLRAMKAVVLPPYEGQEIQVDWEIDFTQADEEKK